MDTAERLFGRLCPRSYAQFRNTFEREMGVSLGQFGILEASFPRPGADGSELGEPCGRGEAQGWPAGNPEPYFIFDLEFKTLLTLY